MLFVIFYVQNTTEIIINKVLIITYIWLLQRMVIQTRSVKYMPFLLSLFNFINGLVWFGYAFIGGVDIYIAVSINFHKSYFDSTDNYYYFYI